MKLYLIVFILYFVLNTVNSRHSHPVPTYFHRKYDNGTYVDRQNEEEFNKVLANEYIPDRRRKHFLYVFPRENLASKQNVTVSWKINIEPSKLDWIGLFCPCDGYTGEVIDYFYVTVAPNWHLGVGLHEVTLYNMRADCEFRYYHFERWYLLASSERITFRNGKEEPLQGHISTTGNPYEMRVMWVSGTVDTPMVYYGLTDPGLILKAHGGTKTYNASMMCAFPAAYVGFKDPGYIHDVLLRPLLPNTRYFYQFGSGKTYSPVYNFTTSLAAGDTSSHTMLTFGDHGVVDCPGATSTADNILQEYRDNNIRHILHNGDISYAMGYEKGTSQDIDVKNQAYIWDQWFYLVQPYTTLIPYMVSVGNHEQDHLTGGSKDPSGVGNGFHPIWGNFGADSGGECGVPMYYRFHMPDNGHSLWWYSYDYGLVHYIVISTEHDFSPSSDQYKWLSNDLQSVDRKLTPWIILAGHRPMYTSQEQLDEIEVSINMQRLFEDLLYEYKVDLALWAHVHSYQRTCAMYKNKCVNNGIVHIVTGTAGRPIDYEFFEHKEWLRYHSNEYGYGRIRIFNSTAIKYEFVINKNRQVLDSVWLLK